MQKEYIKCNCGGVSIFKDCRFGSFQKSSIRLYFPSYVLLTLSGQLDANLPKIVSTAIDFLEITRNSRIFLQQFFLAYLWVSSIKYLRKIFLKTHISYPLIRKCQFFKKFYVRTKWVIPMAAFSANHDAVIVILSSRFP